MATDILTPGNIMFAIGILGVIFTVYNYFRNPQIASDKRESLLSQQNRLMIENNERRFNDMETRFDALLLQSNNHIHTVDVKVDGLASSVGRLGNEITRLTTIIDERIPKRKASK